MAIAIGIVTMCLFVPRWVNASTFYDVGSQLHFDIPTGWQMRRGPGEFTLQDPSQNATINISVRTDSATPIPKSIYQARAQLVFKNWSVVAVRDQTIDEIDRANAEDGCIAVYSANEPTKSNQLTKHWITEFYFVRGTQVVIASFQTSATQWRAINPVIRKWIESFWIGVDQVRVKSSPWQIASWTLPGKDAGNSGVIADVFRSNSPIHTQWEIDWETPTPNWDADLITIPGKLISAHGPKIVARAMQTGSIVWSTQLTAPLTGGIAYGSNLIYGTTRGDQNQLIGVSAHDGSIQFSAPIFGNPTTYPIPIGAGIIIGTDTGVSLHNAKSGQPLWQLPLEIDSTYAPIQCENQIIFAQKSGNLIAINEKNGKLSWVNQLGGKLISRPAVGTGNRFFVVCRTPTSGPQLTARSIATGGIIWKLPIKFGPTDTVRVSEKSIWIMTNATITLIDGMTGQPSAKWSPGNFRGPVVGTSWIVYDTQPVPSIRVISDGHDIAQYEIIGENLAGKIHPIRTFREWIFLAKYNPLTRRYQLIGAE